jgi:diacylglycerol kinase (ATP)
MWLLVLNRSSGKGNLSKTFKNFTDLCKLNGVSYQVIDEGSAGATDSQIQDALSKSDYEAVIAFGGDGLVSICIQHLANSKIGFTVVPTGTGNDFARSIGTYRRSVQDIFESITKLNRVQIDLGVSKSDEFEKYFVQVLSMGFDASVNEFANKMKYPKGKIKYTIAMLFLLPRAKNIEFDIQQNSRSIKVRSMLIAIANGSTYGGGMRILPDASFQDGLLDLLYVDPVSKLTLLSIFPRVFRGTHIKHPAVHLLSASDFQITGLTKTFADGEYAGALPIKISILRNGLTTWICK